MKKIKLIGRLFFAIALIGLGIEHFIFQDFITARAPAWPASIPGKLIWAYLTGAFFIAAGLAILIKKKARLAAILIAVLILLWALLRNIPVVAATSFLSGAWTLAGKSLVFVGGSLTIAAILPEIQNSQNSKVFKFLNLNHEFIITGRICLGLFLLITGIQHFMYTQFVASLIPAWFPGSAVFWTYFAGVALISGGIGLLIPQTAKLAAFSTGLMVFLWFWIVHLPRVFMTKSDAISIFEALAVSGIAFVLAKSWNSALDDFKGIFKSKKMSDKFKQRFVRKGISDKYK